LEADAGLDNTFTAEAVAAVFDIPRDDVIDCFDDFLVAENETGAHGSKPLLLDLGFVPGLKLCRYSFSRLYLQRIWYKYLCNPSQRAVWSRQLAQALETLYDPFTSLVVPKLYTLYLEAGSPKRARAYRHERPMPPGFAAQLAYVRYLIRETAEDDRRGTYRLFDLGFSLCNQIVSQPHLWPEGLPIAEELHRRAVSIADRGCQADALYYRAGFHYYAGQPDPGILRARECVSLCESQPSLPHTTLAKALTVLGHGLRHKGDFNAAKPCYERALVIREKEKVLGPEHPATATSLDNLGGLLQDLGDLAGARPYYERALAIYEEVLGPEHPDTATSLNNLGGAAL
jgi:tetratricopeptide (TPR) repeat protein